MSQKGRASRQFTQLTPVLVLLVSTWPTLQSRWQVLFYRRKPDSHTVHVVAVELAQVRQPRTRQIGLQEVRSRERRKPEAQEAHWVVPRHLTQLAMLAQARTHCPLLRVKPFMQVVQAEPEQKRQLGREELLMHSEMQVLLSALR